MDWAGIEANWLYYKSSAKARWTRISADELEVIGGRRERLASQIQEVYGISKEIAQMQLESWQAALKPAQP
jgi:uncharacterized protein YjbJ (UPF0337 family)